MRRRATHSASPSPVSARKRRTSVRWLMWARAATSSTRNGSPMFSSSQASTGASGPVGGGRNALAYWAWPPTRCGGLTSSRETSLAYD